MKRNSRILQDDEIDLRERIKTLWNYKILIYNNLNILFYNAF
jgi:hypothetical protein